MRISTVAACVAAVTATPMPSARQACGGKAPVAEVDLYGKGDYYQKQGCGASGTDGTVLGHLVGCEEDVWYNPSTVGPQGPEKCQTLQQGGVGSWIIRSCRPGCFGTYSFVMIWTPEKKARRANVGDSVVLCGGQLQ